MIVNGDSISFVDKNAYPVIMSKDEDGHLYLEYQEVKDAVGDVEKTKIEIKGEETTWDE